ncbi:hypothetical protein M569_09647 [Genlisea aurea]|uniref:Uncharacterized protein n=1 Tax=Genlisea aurea TaxID=192259 RepID=S8DPV7_9LAMI|nr:hypothetical protein M569_09647 [Genlisea aurea]
MHRQSLVGSPSSEQIPSEEEMKRPKPRNDSPEIYIHLIPLLTLLCFLLLFLSSHKPSEKDLAEFKAFSLSSSSSSESGNVKEDTSWAENFDKFAEVDAAKHRLLHRKMVGF